MSDLSQLRELVARSCRVLGKLNLTKEPSGHVSARVPGTDKILIKARGPEESGLRFVTAEDIITVDMAGKKVEGPDGLETPKRCLSTPGSTARAPRSNPWFTCIR
mgnify:CR=1 FL=1